MLYRYRYRGDAEVLQLGEERDFSFFPKSLKLIGCPTNWLFRETSFKLPFLKIENKHKLLFLYVSRYVLNCMHISGMLLICTLWQHKYYVDILSL